MSGADVTEHAVPGIVSPKSKEYWGPKIWRLFHLLTEVSDRNDVLLIWKRWIRQTGEIMPCEKCRIHLRQYLRLQPFLTFKDPAKHNGAKTRDYIRSELMTLHNDVNKRTGKPTFSAAQYQETYSKGTKQEILLEAKSLMSELDATLVSLDFMKLKMGEYHEWKNSYALLLALVQ